MVQRFLYPCPSGNSHLEFICSLFMFSRFLFLMNIVQVRVKGEIKPVQPSFYDDIIRLPDILEKVESSLKMFKVCCSRLVLCKKELCAPSRRFSRTSVRGSSTRTCGSSTKPRLANGSLSADPVVSTLMRSCSITPCLSDRSTRSHVSIAHG